MVKAGGGGGGTLIFSYIRRLEPFFWFQNFEFQYFLGFSEKIIFFGHEYFVDIFGGSSQNWTILSCLFYAFKALFLRSMYRIRDIFWGCQNFKYFLGCLKFLIFFWGKW